VPDHSTLTCIRARYGLEVFRRFFHVIVAQCRQAGLVWGKELYFDATQVQADAALDSLTPRFAVEAREAQEARQTNQAKQTKQAEQPKRAVEAHLAALFSDTDPQQPPEQERAGSPGL
jgi:hypothetical protein